MASRTGSAVCHFSQIPKLMISQAHSLIRNPISTLKMRLLSVKVIFHSLVNSLAVSQPPILPAWTAGLASPLQDATSAGGALPKH